MAKLITKEQLRACLERTADSIAEVAGAAAEAIEEVSESMTGATDNTPGTAGRVPTPAAGDNSKFLRGDGTWATPAGGGSSQIDYMFRQSNTQYSEGDIAFLPSLPTGWFLVSEGNGVTANSNLVITTPTIDDEVADGTVTWVIRKMAN